MLQWEFELTHSKYLTSGATTEGLFQYKRFLFEHGYVYCMRVGARECKCTSRALECPHFSCMGCIAIKGDVTIERSGLWTVDESTGHKIYQIIEGF